MINITFYAPYPAMIPIIDEVFKERPDRDEISYEVITTSFSNPSVSIQADAIIARGFTAHAIKQWDIPWAELKTSGYDVIQAVERCLSICNAKSIALVGAFNMVYGSESVSCAYPDVKFKIYPIDDEQLLESRVLEAIDDGCDAIVGGYSTVNIARKHNMSAVMIESGKEAVNSAISQAVTTVNIYRKEKIKSQEIANIMNYSFQGVVSTDKEGNITLVNSYCYANLNFKVTSLTNKKIQDVFPNIPFFDVIHYGKKILSKVYDYEDIPLMINCVPVEYKGENAGCVLTFQKVEQIQAEEGKIRKHLHKNTFKTKYSFSNILYKDEIMADVVKNARDISYSDSSVLIYGETGTGKELFAQSIHNSSSRSNAPFVAINCAALPEDLLESELFGYVEGAFTGAAKGGKMGFFEIAHKGTIFLDEIGDISPKLQSRLLRVLQEQEIIRLGNDEVIPIDVRIISATNKDLKEEVKEGNFRQDLLYRLDVLELNIPPLRERTEDILYLIRHYIHYEHERTGCILSDISPKAASILQGYSWPGNIREIRNFCERICIQCHGEIAESQDIFRSLPDLKRSALTEPSPDKPRSSKGLSEFDSAQRDIIIEALKKHKNNRTLTAQYLGVDKSTLWRKMKKYNLL